MIIAPFIANAPAGLFDYIQQALGSLSVPILAVVLIGILTKKVPALGAKVVLISGVVMYIFTVLVRPGNWENALASAQSSGITDTLELAQIKIDTFPFHFLETMAWLFFINIIIMLVIGLLKPKTDEYIPKQTEAIDTTPWKYAWIVGIIIVLLVLSTYLIF
jgi:SSS family solute:Na+ symporter